MKVQLRVEAESMFGSRFVVKQRLREVGRLRLSWRDRGEIDLDGVTLEVTFSGFFSTNWTLRAGGRTVAKAEKRALSGRVIEIDHDGEAYTLKIAGFFSRTWELRRGSRLVGSVRAASLWTRTQEAEFDEQVAPQLRMFALWLVLVMRRRASRSSGGGGAAHA